jgi:hypothetical protein
LFHTPEARDWREYAPDHIFRLNDEELRLYEASEPLDNVVFDLYGKYCMLRGGVGCIRLRPTPTEAGLLWFVSASSTLSAHEGIPVAITDADYNRYIDYINQHGVLPCALTGRLKFTPERLLSLYLDYAGVPQLYLLVEEIIPSRAPLDLHGQVPSVSVAVTFQSTDRWDNRDFGAAYTSFAPGAKGSLGKRLPWLEHYVATLHDGVIVTDFDEHMTRFRGAVFSLDKVRTGRLDVQEVATVINNINIGNADLLIDGQRALHAHINAGQVNVGQLMGDVFRDIGAGATIINRSNLINAMNSASGSNSRELEDALRQLAEFIEKSGSREAADNFNAFTEELQQPSPRKSLLKSFWNGMLAALPTIAELTTAAGTIALLFAGH